jgi:hypothetical protein
MTGYANRSMISRLRFASETPEIYYAVHYYYRVLFYIYVYYVSVQIKYCILQIYPIDAC